MSGTVKNIKNSFDEKNPPKKGVASKIRWARPDLNWSVMHPKHGGYQATPRAHAEFLCVYRTNKEAQYKPAVAPDIPAQS